MSNQFAFNRGQLFYTAAGDNATALVSSDAIAAEPGRVKLATTIKAGANTSFAALKQIDGDFKKRLAQAPVIAVLTTTMEGDANGALHPEPRPMQNKVSSKYEPRLSSRYEPRLLKCGIGHDLPQEAPQALSKLSSALRTSRIGSGDPRGCSANQVERRNQMTDFRKESDSLGVVEIPADKLSGGQTRRSPEHFSIGADLIPQK